MIKENFFNLLIIGTGAYVCGTKKGDYGTILPAILTYVKRFKQKINITFVCNSEAGEKNAREKSLILSQLIDTNQLVKFDFVVCFGEPDILFEKINIKNKIDSSIIAVPDNFHFKWISAMIKNQIPTLTVKPLTLNISEARKLRDLSEINKTPLFVEFHKRYDRQLRLARDLFISGKLGIPLYSFTEYTQRKEIPMESFKNWCSETNIFSYLGVHYVDALYYITESKPIKVSSTGQKVFLKNQGFNTFDSIQCSIIWEDQNKNFFNQTILSSWVESNLSSAISKQDFNLIGTLGRVSCEQKERGVRFLSDISPTEEINPDFTKMYKKGSFFEFEGYGIDSILNFIHYVNDSDFCIKDRRLCSVNEALVSTSVIDAAYKSLNDISRWKNIELS